MSFVGYVDWIFRPQKRTKPAFKLHADGKKFSEKKEFLLNLERVLGLDETAGESLTFGVSRSSVSCRICNSRVYKLSSALDEIAKFRRMFWEREHSNVMMESVAGPIISRMKRCSKSPHGSGRLKMKAPQHLPVEPIRFPAQLIQPKKTVASRDLFLFLRLWYPWYY